jgi:hypothetical protein
METFECPKLTDTNLELSSIFNIIVHVYGVNHGIETSSFLQEEVLKKQGLR